MNLMMKRMLCHFMVFAMAMLPFQSGQASMIGTDQVVSSAASQVDRNTVNSFLDRAETTSQMQLLGLDAGTAKSRVASMTDSEVASLAGKVSSLPAGGDAGGLIVLILLIVLVYYVVVRR